MIVPYWGEFLVSPAPLEISLNHCSYNCSYCFANLNDPHRQAAVQPMMNLLAEFRERGTYTANLLQEGYPTVLSNRTDPCARSNGGLTLSLVEAMVSLGLPLTIQTKGGPLADDLRAMLPPSVWYISIATLDDAVRAQIEPGAPPIGERLDLIERLRADGHPVVVGVNPCVPEWLGDPAPLLRTLADLGVWGVWIERLHFNYKQSRAMKPWAREAVGPALIARGQKRRTEGTEMAYILSVREAAFVAGLEVYSVGQPTESAFFLPWEETYRRIFPTAQGWLNHCYAQGWANMRLIAFDDFLAYFEPLLPPGRLGIDSYLGATAHNLWWTHKVPPQMTFRELLAIIWSESRSRNCPVRMPAFAYAAKQTEEGWVQYVDERGMPCLACSPEGFDTYFAHVDLEVEHGG